MSVWIRVGEGNDTTVGFIRLPTGATNLAYGFGGGESEPCLG